MESPEFRGGVFASDAFMMAVKIGKARSCRTLRDRSLGCVETGPNPQVISLVDPRKHASEVVCGTGFSAAENFKAYDFCAFETGPEAKRTAG